MTLANFATVSFDPKTEGTVTDFNVTAVTPERTEPLQVIELSKALAEAEAANKAFNEKKKTYQDANMEAIDRVLKAESAGRKLAGRTRRSRPNGRNGAMKRAPKRRKCRPPEPRCPTRGRLPSSA